jgi:hypothetical protein
LSAVARFVEAVRPYPAGVVDRRVYAAVVDATVVAVEDESHWGVGR